MRMRRTAVRKTRRRSGGVRLSDRDRLAKDLENAVKKGNVKRIEEFLADPASDVNMLLFTRKFTLLHLAAYSGKKDIVKVLLADPRTDPNIKDEHGYTPASLTSYKDILKLIVADPRMKLFTDPICDYKNNMLVLISLGDDRDADTLKMLLKDPRVTEEDINRVCKSSNLRGEFEWLTPLGQMAQSNHTKLVKLLLNDPRTDVNKTGPDGRTPFFHAVSFNDFSNLSTINALLADPRVDINKADQDGKTPIYAVVERYSRYARAATVKGWRTEWEIQKRNEEFVEVVELLLANPRLVIDDSTWAMVERDDFPTPEVSNTIQDLFGRFKQGPPPNPNIPAGSENAITFEPIRDGDEMVNFHGERNQGRYYRKATYNRMPLPKKNPFTRRAIRVLTSYIAKVQQKEPTFAEEAIRVFKNRLATVEKEKQNKAGGRRKTRRIR
jgi:hypothetical protein